MKLQQPTDRCTVVGISILHREVRMPDQMQELIARMPTQGIRRHASQTMSSRNFTNWALPRLPASPRMRKSNGCAEVYDLFFSGELELPKGALVRDVNRPAGQAARSRPPARCCFRNRFIRSCARPFFIATVSAWRASCLVGAELHCWGHMLRKPGHSDGHVAMASGRSLLGSAFRPPGGRLLDAAGRLPPWNAAR